MARRALAGAAAAALSRRLCRRGATKNGGSVGGGGGAPPKLDAVVAPAAATMRRWMATTIKKTKPSSSHVAPPLLMVPHNNDDNSGCPRISRGFAAFALSQPSLKNNDDNDDEDCSTTSTTSTTSNAADDDGCGSQFVDVEAAQERARLKAAALAAQDGAASTMYVFDRVVKAAQRDRAAYLRTIDPTGDPTDPFLEEITRRTLDRLSDVKRTFPRVLVLGGAGDAVVRRLLAHRPDVETIVVTDMSRDMLRFVRDSVSSSFESSSSSSSPTTPTSASESASESAAPWTRVDENVVNAAGKRVTIHYVHADEEELPITHGSVDVVISVLGLHWANDLPGAMSQARQALVPDGLFLSAVLGGETLRELRIACAVAELEREGGVSQRVSPLAQVRDCGNLLTRAGMRLPAVDVDTLTMNYPSASKLVEHLRFMGETNAGVSRRRGPVGRETAAAAAACYHFMFPAASGGGGGGDGEGAPEEEEEEGESGGGVEATWQVLYMTGWSPGDGQQQAAERGSAVMSLSQLEEELAKVPDDPK